MSLEKAAREAIEVLKTCYHEVAGSFARSNVVDSYEKLEAAIAQQEVAKAAEIGRAMP